MSTAINMQLTQDSLPCRRHRIKDQQGDNLYVIVGMDDEGHPKAVKASFPNEMDHDKREVLSSWKLACRLVSKSLSRGDKLTEVLDDLKHSQVYSRDVPSQMSVVLSSYA